MSYLAKHWTNLRVDPIMSKLMAKVDRTVACFVILLATMQLWRW